MKKRFLSGLTLFIFCIFTVCLFSSDLLIERGRLERGIMQIEDDEENSNGSSSSGGEDTHTESSEHRNSFIFNQYSADENGMQPGVSENSDLKAGHESSQENSSLQENSGTNGNSETNNKDGKTDSSEEKKEESEKAAFTSIQTSGLTLCSGEKWYFEEFGNDGNVVKSVLYNKDKLITQKDFEYSENGKKIGETVLEEGKTKKIKYNEKGFETEVSESEDIDGETEEVKKTEKVYDGKNRVTELTVTENGITTRTQYVYSSADKVISETVFEDGEKILFIEYKAKVKIIHLFEDGEELNTFEEAL